MSSFLLRPRSLLFNRSWTSTVEVQDRRVRRVLVYISVEVKGNFGDVGFVCRNKKVIYVKCKDSVDMIFVTLKVINSKYLGNFYPLTSCLNINYSLIKIKTFYKNIQYIYILKKYYV